MFCKFSIDIRPFSAIFGVKNTLVNPSIFPFCERDFGRILDILPYFTDGFFSSIFDFFPKKTDFQVKKF